MVDDRRPAAHGRNAAPRSIASSSRTAREDAIATSTSAVLATVILALLMLITRGTAAAAPLPLDQPAIDPPAGAPRATIDLATAAGAALVGGQWRYSDTEVVEVEFPGPGPEGQPTGAPARTYDIVPHAGGVDFDDSAWPVIDAGSLAQRRATGRICFNWYRIAITIPPAIDGWDPTGSTAVFETTLDDYAEIWVDGELARGLGQSGGSVIAGWNAPNRLVVGRGVKPGQRIQLAVFGINGPLSNPPTNFIYLRGAKLSFHDVPAGPIATQPREVNVEVVRLDPAFDGIVGPNPKLHKLAEGFAFTEGPIWVPDGAAVPANASGVTAAAGGSSGLVGGYLLFSDPNSNTVYKFTPGVAGGAGAGAAEDRLEVFRRPSGYDAPDVAVYGQPGSNGLTLDLEGRLVVNEHGNRRVTRTERDGSITVLADRYQGRRFNSPNDLVYRSDGTLFISDPPFGLPEFFADPRKELPWSGVFALRADGELRIVTTELTGPNGVALSPDERYLYVGNWDEKRKVVMRYELAADGSARRGELFFDLTSAPGEDAIDGVKVDRLGNVYVSGPGGLWVLSPEGRHLGTIKAPRHIHNMAWGDDGRALYLCARDSLYRMRLGVEGVMPPRAMQTSMKIVGDAS